MTGTYFKYFTTRDHIMKYCLMPWLRVSNGKHWLLLHHSWNWLTEQQMCVKESRQKTRRKLLLPSNVSVSNKKAPTDNKTHCLFFHLFINFIKRIGSRLQWKCCIFKNSIRLQAVKSAATSGKLYRLPVDKENTVKMAGYWPFFFFFAF